MSQKLAIKIFKNLFQTLTPKNRFFATEATFKTEPYRLHRFEKGPPPETTLTRDDALIYYQRMVTIRKMEQAAAELYKSKVIRGFCHLYSGQEAVAVGIHSTFRSNDSVIATYRCHAWGYLLQNSVEAVIAELVGVQSGCERGKGGSMHIFAKNFYGGQAIVGAHVPVGGGVALAHKYKNDGGFCLIVYGDGASNSGQVFETYNMAKLWDLPCVFLIENNQYAMGTSVGRSSANPDFYVKGDLIPGIWVDGMDILTVREAMLFCIDHIVKGKGPVVMEAYTYRYFGHSMSDPGTTYRTREEVAKVRQTKDPITSFKQKILDSNLATENELKDIDKKAKADVEKAVEKAKNDKPIDVKELTYDIYSNDVIKEVRGVNPFSKWEHKHSGKGQNM